MADYMATAPPGPHEAWGLSQHLYQLHQTSLKMVQNLEMLPGLGPLESCTGFLGEETGRLWHRIPAERNRLRRKVAWQSS